jgi:hypothetical protein
MTGFSVVLESPARLGEGDWAQMPDAARAPHGRCDCIIDSPNARREAMARLAIGSDRRG